MRAIALITLLLTLGTANADDLTVIGNPDADDCYLATMLPYIDAEASIVSCNLALNTRRTSWEGQGVDSGESRHLVQPHGRIRCGVGRLQCGSRARLGLPRGLHQPRERVFLHRTG